LLFHGYDDYFAYTVEFDPALGYPRSIKVVPPAGTRDMDLAQTVTYFKIVEPAPATQR
jgi:hypothetical protein